VLLILLHKVAIAFESQSVAIHVKDIDGQGGSNF